MFKMLKIAIVMSFLCGSPTYAGAASSVMTWLNQETGQHIESLLENRNSSPAPLAGVARMLFPELIFSLYQQRQFQPVWFDGWLLMHEAQVFLETLRNAGAHGLCGNDYLLVQLEVLVGMQTDFARKNLPLSADNRAILDLFLSQAFLTYATHMVEGQVDPALAHVDWSARGRKADLVKLLEYAVANSRLSQVLEDLLPPHAEYRQLADALQAYQEISAAGGWPTIPPGPTIRPGDLDDRVQLLRSFLLKTGDLERVTETSNVYDDGAFEALRRFQSRHGLVDDGVVGEKTLRIMNVPVEERIRQIELNLERWRWMPKSFGERHIRVNIADFSLAVFKAGEPVMQIPVIVGTQYRKTPVFSARMTYLEFAPYWIVPPTILREDKLPAIKRNPDYLAEKHFRIVSRSDKNVLVDPREIDWTTVKANNFPGLLRMEPGPWNPLGRVKFMFPNSFNVYLHDTNEKNLFDNNIRSFSSGCIRVKRPYDLAFFLLGEDLGRERLQALFEAKTPVQVSVRPLPVHIQYWTAWVDREGLVHFRPDVYFRDLDLDIALAEPAYRVMEQLQAGAGTKLTEVDEG